MAEEIETDRFVYHPYIRTFFWKDFFYVNNKDAILEWAEQHNCKVEAPKYGWIEVPDDNVKLLFMLRWS